MSGELLGAARAASGTFSVLQRLSGLARSAASRRADVARARELLGLGQPGSFSYRVGDHHPIYNVGDPHPDDRAAFHSVLSAAISPSLREDEIDTSAVVPCPLEDGLVLVGSPEGEPVARLAFGYRRTSTGELEYVGDTLELPFRWEEDRRKVEVDYARYVAGRGLVWRPNWPIIDHTGSEPRARRVQLDNNGFSTNDWLVLTRLPNFLSREGLHGGRAIISVAGAHGTATRAFENLLHDRTALQRIGSAVGADDDGFQALIEVSDIVHDPQRGSYARKIAVRDVVPIRRSQAAWDAALHTVEGRYDAWLAELTADHEANA